MEDACTRKESFFKQKSVIMAGQRIFKEYNSEIEALNETFAAKLITMDGFSFLNRLINSNVFERSQEIWFAPKFESEHIAL